MTSLRAFHAYEPQCLLRVTGLDAGAYLQGQFSNDLSKVSVGQCVYGLWLDRKGKIVADSFALRTGEEEFSLCSYHCPESKVFDRLDAFLVMEEAELVRLGERVFARCLFGEDIQRGACSALGIEFPQRGAFSVRSGVIAFWGRRCSAPVLELVFMDRDSSDCIDKTDAYLGEMGVVALRDDELLALAIQGKVPLIGLGFGESDLPQELGLEVDAVSFRKGCYLGQEVMARLHAMGRVRKGLRVVGVGEADEPAGLELPADLFDEGGKRQGQLRSVAYPKSGGIGLALVSSGFQGVSLRAGAVEVRLLDEEVSGRG